MGGIIKARKLSLNQTLFWLLIYSKTELSPAEPFSVNKPLAEKLIKLKPTQRTIQLGKCFSEVISTLPSGVVIKDIDVLFNPAYKVDVIKILASAYKQKRFSLVWPGTYSDGKLIYSEEGYPDYRVYEIKDYDIMYVI